ncbi:MAG: glycosyltransferase family 4 protein [bacterium]|nr:glycosyltransferase family 4 protein [bacterium]
MKIAVTSPPWVPIPPVGYGGIERVVYNVVEGLVKKGHDVTLFATGDSQTSAHLKYFYKGSLGNHMNMKLNPFYITAHLHEFYKNADGYDIIHDNAAELSVYYSDFTKTPCLYTIHGSLYIDPKDVLSEYNYQQTVVDSFKQFKHLPFISISNYQRKGLPELNYIKTIYNSVILSEFDFNPTGGTEMIWLGRMTPAKGVHIAIKIAQTVQKNINLSGFLDKGDAQYYETQIKPSKNLGFVAEVPEIKSPVDKSKFLGNSRLFLFPIQWDEPFGIVMIEAMVTGTPVVAMARGSVPEIVKDGETGFLVNPSDQDIRGDWIIKKTGFEGLCEAVERVYSMPEDKYMEMRKACRAHVENNFTLDVMVDAYEKAYLQVLDSK